MSPPLAGLLLLLIPPLGLCLHWYVLQDLRRELRQLRRERELERSELTRQLREDLGELLSALHAEVLLAQNAERPQSLHTLLQISLNLKLQLRRLQRQLHPDRARLGLAALERSDETREP